MFNLLPENLKQVLKSEYKLRFSIIVLLFIIFSQICFFIFLFPSWLVSNYRQEEFSTLINVANSSLQNQDIGSTTDFIKTVNTRLNLVNDTLSYPMMFPVIDQILAKRKPEIKLDGIFYTVNSEKSVNISISGIASSRESLVSFSNSLKTIEDFKKVDLPISNLAKDKNIDFTISINLEK